jgi:hypothetical protein
MSKSHKGHEGPSNEEIAAYAYDIYIQEGRPEGKHQEHWLQAEAHLIADRKARALETVAKSTAKAAPPANPTPKAKAKNATWQTGQATQPPAARANPN